MMQLPAALHGQLKALADARGVTMVDVVHQTVRQAIEAGELADETPGLKVSLLLDLDAQAEADQGPFVMLRTPKGEFPAMTRDDAESVARSLSEIQAGSEAVFHRLGKNGELAVSILGRGVEIVGRPWADGETVRSVMPLAIARDLARQMRNVAQSAAPDAE